jgi:hypothetical protein
MTTDPLNDTFYVLPTIDTEGVHGRRPFEQFARGEIDCAEDWGALKLARIFNEYGVTGTFFVDVYEHSLFTEAPVAELCVDLCELGQDVQLHTHPSWRDDPRDSPELRQLKRTSFYMPQHLDFMAKLAVEQQTEVLEAGSALLHKWIGQRPIVHRSGGYSIDANTIVALANTGIPVDSSMNSSHSNSRITWSRNKIVERGGVIELPVTVARVAAGVPGLPLYGRALKTDVNVLSARHMQMFCEDARTNGLRFMNYFMHSYSLLDYSGDFESIRPHFAVEKELRKFLEWATAEPSISVVNCRAFYDLLRQPGFDRGESDHVPVIQDSLLVLRKGLKKVSHELARALPVR